MAVQVHAQRGEAAHEQRVVPQSQVPGQALQALESEGGLLGRTEEDPLETEQRLGHAPTLVDSADQAVVGHPHVVEKHFAELAVQLQVEDRPHLDARAVHRHQQEADAVLRLGAALGADQQEDPVGLRAHGGPGLLSVDHPLAVFQARLGAQAGQVGAGVGLAVALAPDVFAAENARQEARPLRLVAIADQQWAEHGHAAVGQARAAVLLHFLHHDQLLAGAQPHAAVLPGPAGTQPALARQQQVPLAGFLAPQATGRIADALRIVGGDPLTDHQAKGVVIETVVVAHLSFL